MLIFQLKILYHKFKVTFERLWVGLIDKLDSQVRQNIDSVQQVSMSNSIIVISLQRTKYIPKKTKIR